MSLIFDVFSDLHVGNFNRLDYNGLTLYCCEDLRLCKAGRCEGVKFTLFGYGLWTVGLEDGKFLFFDGLETG